MMVEERASGCAPLQKHAQFQESIFEKKIPRTQLKFSDSKGLSDGKFALLLLAFAMNTKALQVLLKFPQAKKISQASFNELFKLIAKKRDEQIMSLLLKFPHIHHVESSLFEPD